MEIITCIYVFLSHLSEHLSGHDPEANLEVISDHSQLEMYTCIQKCDMRMFCSDHVGTHLAPGKTCLPLVLHSPH